SEGRKREFAEFGWDPNEIPDPQDPDTFIRSKLDWSEVAREPHSELLQWHRDLISLRRHSPELTDGRLVRVNSRFDEQARWLTMRRGAIELLINFAQQGQELPLSNAENWRLLLGSRSDIAIKSQLVEMPPESVVLVRIG